MINFSVGMPDLFYGIAGLFLGTAGVSVLIGLAVTIIWTAYNKDVYKKISLFAIIAGFFLVACAIITALMPIAIEIIKGNYR